jgi:outer membrane protein TolC
MIIARDSHPAGPAKSAGPAQAGSSGAKAGSTEQDSKSARTQDRIARRAYELYEQRERRDGWALEDWLNAERQLAAQSAGGKLT